MKHDNNGAKTDRRSFMKLAGLGAVGTIAAAASSGAADAEELTPQGGKHTRSQYRETEHVKQMYDLARF